MTARYADPRVNYSSPFWKALRNAHLKKHHVCVYCMQMGKVVRGTYVDHKIPHRGDYKLFSDPANLQTLCKIHANATKQKEELTGTTQGCSLTGWPLGEEHPWNNGGKAPPRRTTVSTHTIHSLKRRKRK